MSHHLRKIQSQMNPTNNCHFPENQKKNISKKNNNSGMKILQHLHPSFAAIVYLIHELCIRFD